MKYVKGETTYTYTLPQASGTLALTNNAVELTSITNTGTHGNMFFSDENGKAKSTSVINIHEAYGMVGIGCTAVNNRKLKIQRNVEITDNIIASNSYLDCGNLFTKDFKTIVTCTRG